MRADLVTYLSRRYAPLGDNSTTPALWRTLAVWRQHVSSVTVYDLTPDTAYEFAVSASRRHASSADPTSSGVLHSPAVIARTSAAAGISFHSFILSLNSRNKAHGNMKQTQTQKQTSTPDR